MAHLLHVYDAACSQAQAYFESYISEIPQDLVKGCVKNFVYSFSVSALLSGGNLAAGLSGGALAITATLLHGTVMTAFKKLQIHLSSRFDKPIQPDGFEQRHVAFMLGWGSALYLGHALGLAINFKASFYATVPFRIWNIFSTKQSSPTPLMGTIVV
jgi:hypothetical protein